jgi:hypothetical protein
VSSDIWSDKDLLEFMDGAHARSCRAQRELLTFVAEAERRELWWTEGARDMAHLLSMRYGISYWKAERWVQAARALRELPKLADAFATGSLGIDKVVELTRFATPETEASLIPWAERVPSGRIREEGDLAAKRAREETEMIERDRRLDWWFHDEGRRFSLVADLPAAEGAAVARAIERVAETLPVSPEDHGLAEARRADALVALATGRGAGTRGAGTGRAGTGGAGFGETERPTVVVHVPIGSDVPSGSDLRVSGRHSGFAIEGGGVVPPETLARLVCQARVQGVVDNTAGDVVRLGRASREPSDWMIRQLRHRDRGCVFPMCGAKRFTQAHHVRWWSAGGRTDLGNLVLACTTHHKLVHEHGWSLTRRADGTVRWYRPDGRRYRAGPAPPRAPATDGQLASIDQLALA